MNVEVKNLIDDMLLTKSIDEVIQDIKKNLQKSRDMKEYFIRKNMDLKNIPSHIEMFEEIISYLRDKKISSLFERRILRFKDFK